jgi:mono/diheme cytochrome c family protein
MNPKVLRNGGMAVALLIVALLVAACGGAPEPTASPVVSEPTQPPPEPTVAEPTQPPPEPTVAEPTQPSEPTQPPQEEKLFPPEMPSAVRGEAVYTTNCVSCHGEAGDGSGLAGAADFTDVELVRGAMPAQFFEAIRDGVEGTAMPAWGDTLSEMEIWDVLYYEWTFATSPEEIAQGQGLFSANCVACHGQQRSCRIH